MNVRKTQYRISVARTRLGWVMAHYKLTMVIELPKLGSKLLFMNIVEAYKEDQSDVALDINEEIN